MRHFIEANGIGLHIADTGPKDAPAVVFGNSLGCDMRIWDGVLPHLPRGLRLIRYDSRGHGLSDCPAGPYAMGTLVRDAEALLDALEVPHTTCYSIPEPPHIDHTFSERLSALGQDRHRYASVIAAWRIRLWNLICRLFRAIEIRQLAII